MNVIIDDGDCTDHGYFIPKQKVKARTWSNEGCSAVEVPQSELLKALEESSARQQSLVDKLVV